ncbi:DUF2537 domain-containing protein [Actinokineospora sp. 24-640]
MELRARDERAVLVGRDAAGQNSASHDSVSQGSAGQSSAGHEKAGHEREIDLDTLSLDADLVADLHEWAKVAAAVGDADPDSAGSVVSRRGLRLVGQVADALGTPVGYVDPVTGEVSVVDPGATVPAPPAPVSAEPTPWGTGLLVSAFALVLVVFAVVTLASTLNETSPLLALGANVVVTAGLLPSVWLTRAVPVWRWVAFGVVAGIFAGWVALPFIIFGGP